ncbi:hypothetical protein QE152_g15718 [Popillia japonica]|uniref:PHD-type domain-containing protein n=1 Tax=Popillia japonica TaxID=7064 RepID=A0AAW1L6Y1_POPJA
MSDCDKCGEKLPSDGGFIPCLGCNGAYHYDCSIQLSTYNGMDSQKRRKWRCVACRNKTRGQDTKPMDETNSSFVDDIRQIKKIVEQMTTKLDKNSEECAKIAKEYEEIRKTQEELQNSMRNIEKKVNELLVDNKTKDNTIRILSDKIAELEQDGLERNIEIFGVEENEGEVLEDIVEKVTMEKVTNKFGVTINKNSIEEVKRNGRGRAGKGRPIVVKVKNGNLKRMILKQKKVVVKKT